MEAITGNKNLVGHTAILPGYKLCLQKLHHVPDLVFPNSPIPISPRKILETAWRDDFESYSIIKGGEGDEVVGVVWELTPEERDLVREWELIDFGWAKDIEAIVSIEGNTKIKILTEGIRDGQEFDSIVDGKEYKEIPVPLEDLKLAIEKCRKEYFSRITEKHA